MIATVGVVAYVPRPHFLPVVFPHQPAVGAALLARGITHTTMKLVQGMDCSKGSVELSTPVETRSLLAAAEAVCSTEPIPVGVGEEHLLVRRSGAGLGVCPQQGLAIVFFSRHVDTGGAVDPASWHGGSDTMGAEKWILQKFKSVPRDVNNAYISEESIRDMVCRITGTLLNPEAINEPHHMLRSMLSSSV